MRLKVDQKNDALYLRLDESAIVDSEEIKPGVILDYDAKENVVGIEILGLSHRMPIEKMKSVQIETA
ncbi:MAG: DUF2283 domain-containing protein [Bacteroidetes bacterium]|nr:DUF2283 domain-containing protein [Bacteroidota bacterium]